MGLEAPKPAFAGPLHPFSAKPHEEQSEWSEGWNERRSDPPLPHRGAQGVPHPWLCPTSSFQPPLVSAGLF